MLVAENTAANTRTQPTLGFEPELPQAKRSLASVVADPDPSRADVKQVRSKKSFVACICSRCRAHARFHTHLLVIHWLLPQDYTRP